jgi:hypothetical protein
MFITSNTRHVGVSVPASYDSIGSCMFREISRRLEFGWRMTDPLRILSSGDKRVSTLRTSEEVIVTLSAPPLQLWKRILVLHLLALREEFHGLCL